MSLSLRGTGLGWTITTILKGCGQTFSPRSEKQIQATRIASGSAKVNKDGGIEKERAKQKERQVCMHAHKSPYSKNKLSVCH